MILIPHIVYAISLLVVFILQTTVFSRITLIAGSPDLPQLVKQTTKTLALTPDDIPETPIVFVASLSNISGLNEPLAYK